MYFPRGAALLRPAGRHLRRRWRRFLAYYRLDLRAVCEESAGLLPGEGYHDYPDSTVGAPWHMYLHTCKRCGKKFTI